MLGYKLKLALLILVMIQSCYSEELIIKSKKFNDIIAFCEFMGGKKTIQPSMIKMDKEEALLGEWIVPGVFNGDDENIEFDKGGKIKESDLKWSIDGDCVFIDHSDNRPMAIIVKTKEGYRIFNGDFWGWPLVTKRPNKLLKGSGQ